MRSSALSSASGAGKTVRLKTPTLFFLLLSILLLLLYFRGVFSATLNVSGVDPIAIVRSETFKFHSQASLYVRGASLTITAGRITSITVAVYNSGTSAATATVFVEVYDDGGNLIGSGSGSTRITGRRTSSLSISLSPQPQYSAARRIEVFVSGAL